ncbi:MAG: zf-HC2 domain-containing protein [Proteobacteria bacterium]|nr:zf-HC2 domain-containing protein [Pseudomonadota bacterium]
MRCRDIDRLASRYIDGDLDEARLSALRGHLRGCSRCLELVEDMATIRDTAAGLEFLDPPASLWRKVEQGLAEAEIADANRSWLWLRWQAVRPFLLHGAVAVGAAVVLILWLWRPGEGPAMSTPIAGDSVKDSVGDSGDDGVHNVSELFIDRSDGSSGGDFFAMRSRELVEADRRYRAIIDDLRRLAAQERANWPADLSAIFDARLAVFDREARQQKQALVVRHGRDRSTAHPTAKSRDALYAVYQAEIDFLQAVVVDGVVIAGRDPDQPGALP